MKKVTFFLSVLRDSLKQFFKYRYYIRSSALTYTSLLSCVPLVSVLVAIFSKLPLVKDQLPKLQSFVFNNFLPEQGEKVVDYIQLFASQAQKLPWSQFIFLIVISVMLVFSVERTLNHVWGGHHLRRAWHSVLFSWGIIILTTFFVGFSLMLSSYVLSMPLFGSSVFRAIFHEYLSWWLPFLSSFVGFSLLYIVMPSQKMLLKTALAGGLVGSILFEMGKHIFAWYIHTIPTYNTIYGALATIPLFMVWIYFFWSIVIYGAIVTHQLNKHITQNS